MPNQNDPIAPPIGSIQRDYDREHAFLTKNGLNPLSGTMKPTDLYEAVYSPDELAQMSEYQEISGLKQGYNTAKEDLLATQRPTTTGLRILENGLRAKGKIGEEELGESNLFEAAGLSGYAVLSQSLAERGNEIEQKYQSFASQLKDVSTSLKDTFNLAVDRYNILKEDYMTEVTRFQSVLDDLTDHEQSLAYLEKQHENSKELAAWKASLDKKSEASVGTFGKDYSSSYAGGDWDSPSVQAFSNIFIPPEESSYRVAGEWECGEGFNDLTDGAKVGNSWKSKLDATTKKKNPTVGNGLMIPLGGTTNGHAAIVLDYDEDTETVYTVEFNHDGNGKQTFEQYTIDELNQAYPDNWGFTDSTLKPQYQAQFDSAGGTEAPPWLQVYIDKYANGTIELSAVDTAIEKMSGLSTAEKDYYQTLFRSRIDVKDKDNETENAFDAAGKPIEDLPYPLNIVWKGLIEGESPQEAKERKSVQGIIQNKTNMDKVLLDIGVITETGGVGDFDLEKESKASVIEKLTGGIGLTDYQAELLYYAILDQAGIDSKGFDKESGKDKK